MGPFGWFFGSAFGAVGFLVSLAVFFLPTIIAVARHHRNTLAILTTNKGIVKLVLEVVHGVMNLAAYGDNGMIYSEPLDRVILGARKMLEKPTG